ncbi:MAG: HD domain-containing protein [Candidatus Woesearchaeota archaeon]
MECTEIIRKIDDIYDRFSIPSFLAHHMRTVAAIGRFVCDNLQETLDTDCVVAALLLHDLGNVVKFDLDSPLTDKLCSSAEKNQLKRLQTEFRERYGASADEATMSMVAGLDVPQKVTWLLENANWLNIETVRDSASFELKVCAYADYRVSPTGIVSLEERLSDLRRRYQDYPHTDTLPEDEVRKRDAAYYDIEKQLFSRADITPEDITEETIPGFES